MCPLQFLTPAAGFESPALRELREELLTQFTSVQTHFHASIFHAVVTRDHLRNRLRGIIYSIVIDAIVN